MKLFAL
jgi:DNA polymerase elongation subunit (family B)